MTVLLTFAPYDLIPSLAEVCSLAAGKLPVRRTLAFQGSSYLLLTSYRAGRISICFSLGSILYGAGWVEVLSSQTVEYKNAGSETWQTGLWDGLRVHLTYSLNSTSSFRGWIV